MVELHDFIYDGAGENVILKTYVYTRTHRSHKNISIYFHFESYTGRKNIITTYMDMSVIIIMTFDQSHATVL